MIKNQKTWKVRKEMTGNWKGVDARINIPIPFSR
jgi:hypothetical protein